MIATGTDVKPLVCSVSVKAAEFANNTDANFEQSIRDLLHMPNYVIGEPENRNFYYQDALIPNPISNPSLEIMQQDNPNLPAYWHSIS